MISIHRVRLLRATVILLFCVLNAGCKTCIGFDENTLSKLDLQASYDNELKSRCCESEFQANLSNGTLSLYSVGSVPSGYRFPGITRKQYRDYVSTLNFPTTLYRVWPHINVQYSEEPLADTLDFVYQYNQLVLGYLKYGDMPTSFELPSSYSDPYRAFAE